METNEYFVTLDVKQFDREVKLLKLFEEDMEILDKEDAAVKHRYVDCLVRCTPEVMAKYIKIKKIFL